MSICELNTDLDLSFREGKYQVKANDSCIDTFRESVCDFDL